MPFTLDPDLLADPLIYPYRPQTDERALPVIHFRSAVITKLVERDAGIRNNQVPGQDGLLWATLIDRQGKWISRGILERFAVAIDGFASTYNTTTHLLAIGRDPRAMAQAASRVRELGGGIVLVERSDSAPGGRCLRFREMSASMGESVGKRYNSCYNKSNELHGCKNQHGTDGIEALPDAVQHKFP